MLLLQKFCAEQVSTACFRNSLPLLCMFYFVVCLVSFWLPQAVQHSEENYITCNSPSSQLTELALNITLMVSLLFFLADKLAFSSKLFSSLYTFFFWLRTFTVRHDWSDLAAAAALPYFHFFNRRINGVIYLCECIYLFFLCMIAW